MSWRLAEFSFCIPEKKVYKSGKYDKSRGNSSAFIVFLNLNFNLILIFIFLFILNELRWQWQVRLR